MLRRLWSNGNFFTRLLLLDFLPPIHGPQQLHLSFRVSQQSFSEHAASRFRLEVCNRVPIMTPYCLGCPFIPSLTRTQTTPNYRKRKSTYQSICGSINCLDISNCSGVVTVLSFLTAYQMAPNHGYYEASLYAPRYLVRTSSFGLLYNSDAPTFKNPSSASPLTTTRRPTWMLPLPNLMNLTSQPRTPTPAGEPKSGTLSPTARNSCSINSAPCPSTLSLDAEAFSLGNISGNAAPSSARRNQKSWRQTSASKIPSTSTTAPLIWT